MAVISCKLQLNDAVAELGSLELCEKRYPIRQTSVAGDLIGNMKEKLQCTPDEASIDHIISHDAHARSARSSRRKKWSTQINTKTKEN